MTFQGPRSARGSLAADVAAARSGDRAAFRRLLERYGAAAHGVVVAVAGAQEAEDLMQDVCLIAWRELDSLRDPARFGPWLMALARNAARRSLRKRPGRTVPLDGEIASHADRERRDAEELLAELAHVPEAFREVLAMRLVEGLDGPEIAEATGRSPGAVRVALSRGLAHLRERLERVGWER